MFEDFFENIKQIFNENEKNLPEVRKEDEGDAWDTGREATAYWKNPLPDTIWKN